jgi:hypothetical protein
MARITSLYQRHPKVGQMFYRGPYTQKKKVWEAMESLVGPLDSMILFDDVAGTESRLSYSRLCDSLRLRGRAVVARPDGEKEFMLLDSELNSLRNWDVDDDGSPIPNPVPEPES